MGNAIPSISQCLGLMDRYGMLDNIRAHSLTVARVAEALLAGMAESRANETNLPDAALVLAGALLHDIAKTICLNTQCDHARKGRDICLELGYPLIAEIVREHVVLRDFSTDRYAEGIFFAKEIVYYADKRVRHDCVVSLDERMAYIIERYGNNDQQRHQIIEENFQRCKTLEQHLFFHVNFATDELADKISEQSIPVTVVTTVAGMDESFGDDA